MLEPAVIGRGKLALSAGDRTENREGPVSRAFK